MTKVPYLRKRMTPFEPRSWSYFPKNPTTTWKNGFGLTCVSSKHSDYSGNKNEELLYMKKLIDSITWVVETNMIKDFESRLTTYYALTSLLWIQRFLCGSVYVIQVLPLTMQVITNTLKWKQQVTYSVIETYNTQRIWINKSHWVINSWQTTDR